MSKRMPISDFVSALRAALQRKDGYIMGATGQDPKKWAENSWWFNQYSGAQKTKALNWRKNAARVWDCNGLAEGLYKDFSGVDINTKARYNYAQWCDPKGKGTIPAQYRVPGAERPVETVQAMNEEGSGMQMKIAETVVAVTWEDNESVEALRALCAEEPLEISMSMYGGFEQVDPLGAALPRDDARTTSTGRASG